MVLLAGGFAEMEAVGLPQHEVGVGVEKVSPEKAVELAGKFGTSPEHFETLITGGDYRYAFELASEAAGSDEEAAAYLEWLERRTLNLVRHPIFWPGVSAVARGLCEAERLSGRAIRELIASSLPSLDNAVRKFLERTAHATT